MAPELFNDNFPYTFDSLKQVDSWALGVMIYIAVYKVHPFKIQKGENIWKEVINQSQVDKLIELERRESKCANPCRKEACGLIEQLLKLNPSERMTPAEAMEHAWFKDSYYPQLSRPNMSEILRNHLRS